MTFKFHQSPHLHDLTTANLPPRAEFDCSLIQMLERIKMKSLTSIGYKTESMASGQALWQAKSESVPTGVTAEKLISSISQTAEGKIVEHELPTEALNSLQNTSKTEHGGPLWWNLNTFFFSPFVHLEVHSRHENRTRRSDLTLDVRPLGILAPDEIGHSQTALYNCRAEETLFGSLISGDSASSTARLLPSLLNTGATSRVSDILPLNLYPREWYGDADVGAIVAMREDPFSFVIKPYWSIEALKIGMNHIQEIGIDLLDNLSIAQSELRGYGVRDFKRASALLTLIFESVALFTSQNFPDEAVSGLSGVAVKMNNDNSYTCTIATLALKFEDALPDKETGRSHLKTKDKFHRVFEVEVKRDPFGFITQKVTSTNTAKLTQLCWHEKLTPLIEEDPLAELGDIALLDLTE